METNKTFHTSPANLLSIRQAALGVRSKCCSTQAASHWISIPVTLIFPFFAWFSFYRTKGKFGAGNLVPDIKFSSSPSLRWLFETQENGTEGVTGTQDFSHGKLLWTAFCLSSRLLHSVSIPWAMPTVCTASYQNFATPCNKLESFHKKVRRINTMCYKGERSRFLTMAGNKGFFK